MSEMENILKEPPHVQPDSPNVLEPVFEPPLKKGKFSKIFASSFSNAHNSVILSATEKIN